MDSGFLASLGPGMTHSLPRKLQSHLAVTFRIIAPPLAHFDEEEEVHRLFDRSRDFGARRGSNGLDGLPALAEHDLALAFALDIDRLFDTDGAVPQLLPYLGLDRRVVRQF